MTLSTVKFPQSRRASTRAVLLAAALLASGATPLFAAPKDAPSSAKSTSTRAETPRALYEKLRRSYRVDSRVTLAKVRADRAANSGRAIEVRGIIGGVLRNGQTRTMLLKTGGETLTFLVSPQLPGGDSVRSGAAVRVLALVAPPTANVSNVELSLLAIGEDVAPPPAPEVAPAKNIPPRELIDDSAVVTQMLQLDDRVVPPMATMRNPGGAAASIIPQPPAAQPPKIGATVPGIDADDNSADDDFYRYKRMAKRFNPKLSEAQANEIGRALPAAAAENGIDSRFLAAIIAVESDFDIYCLSNSGAMGLGQLMPFNVPEARIKNAWNPTENLFGTARLLRGHLKDFAGRRDENGRDVSTLLAVAAYNAGPNAVKRAGYKVPRGSQVQRYVWKVYARYKEFAPELFR